MKLINYVADKFFMQVRTSARDAIRSGRVRVNGVEMKDTNYQLKPGDVISYGNDRRVYGKEGYHGFDQSG